MITNSTGFHFLIFKCFICCDFKETFMITSEGKKKNIWKTVKNRGPACVINVGFYYSERLIVSERHSGEPLVSGNDVTAWKNV